MRSLRQAGAVLALLLFVSSFASAQRRAGSSGNRPKVLELGTDAELSIGLDDPGYTSVAIPVSMVRIGIHVTPAFSIEPFGRISYFKLEGFDGSTNYDFGVGGLYHFSADRTKSQTFVRPFLMLDGGSNQDSEIGVGIGLGWKLRPRMNGRLQWRTEVNLFSINDAMSLNGLFGISLYPR